MKIKAAVCYEFDKPLVVEELELADPRENEVLVKVMSSGICATDITCVRDGFGGRDTPPIVFGHEGAGVVEKVGPRVTEFKVGDHVAVSYPYCGKCKFCLDGKPWFCDNAFPLIHGGYMEDGFTPLSKDGKEIHNFFGASCFASHLVSNVKNVAKIDNDADISLMGPLACGFMTGSGAVLNSLKPEPSATIVVSGLGGIGMGAIMAAKICGCKKIIAVDVVDSRLEKALEVGATHAINSSKVDVVEEVMKLTEYGADYVVECSGATPCVKNAYLYSRCEGTIAMVGVSNHVEFDHFFLDTYSKRIVSINMGMANPKRYIPMLVEYYKKGMYPIDKLITKYSLEDVNKAMEDSKAGVAIKPVIVFD